MNHRLFQAWGLIATTTWFPPIAQAVDSAPPPPAELQQADQVTFNAKTQHYVASGHVVLKWGNALLHTDRATISRLEQTFHATGHVDLVAEWGALVADDLTYNFETKNGIALNATMTIDREFLQYSTEKIQVTFHGEVVRYQEQERRLILNHGGFTPCHCPSGAPSWAIRGRAIDAPFEGWGVARCGSIRVKGLPLFWTPRLPFPTSDPNWWPVIAQEGGSLNLGLGYHKDLTDQTRVKIVPIWAFQRGPRLRLGERSKIGKKGRTKSSFEYLYDQKFARYLRDKNFDADHQTHHRWAIDNETYLPLNDWTLRANIGLLRDDLYLTDFSPDLNNILARETVSTVSLVQESPQRARGIEASFIEDRVGGGNAIFSLEDPKTLHQLPHLFWNERRDLRLLGHPWNWGWESLADFRYRGDPGLEDVGINRDGSANQQFDLAEKVRHVVFGLTPFLSTTTQSGPLSIQWLTRLDTRAFIFQDNLILLAESGAFEDRSTAGEWEIESRATVGLPLMRSFNRAFHLFTPEISIGGTRAASDRAVPQVYGSELFADDESVGLAIHNRWSGNRGKKPWWLSLDLTSAWHPRSDTSDSVSHGTRRPWDDLHIDLDLKWGPIGLGSDINWDLYGEKADDLLATASWSPFRWISVWARYTAIDEQISPLVAKSTRGTETFSLDDFPKTSATKSILTGTTLRLSAPLSLRTQTLYSFLNTTDQQSQVLYNQFDLLYNSPCRCWGWRLRIRDTTGELDLNNLTINFSLDLFPK